MLTGKWRAKQITAYCFAGINNQILDITYYFLTNNDPEYS